MGIISKIAGWIVTLGPIGYLPAPGTWGTLCAALSIYCMRGVLSQTIVVSIIACIAIGAFWCVNRVLPYFQEDSDPAEIVIDEYIGFSLLACTIPVNPIIFGISFVLFRFFDILKPLGIKKIEYLPGALGIMLDDMFAACYAGLCVHVVLYACLI